MLLSDMARFECDLYNTYAHISRHRCVRGLHDGGVIYLNRALTMHSKLRNFMYLLDAAKLVPYHKPRLGWYAPSVPIDAVTMFLYFRTRYAVIELKFNDQSNATYSIGTLSYDPGSMTPLVMDIAKRVDLPDGQLTRQLAQVIREYFMNGDVCV